MQNLGERSKTTEILVVPGYVTSTWASSRSRLTRKFYIFVSPMLIEVADIVWIRFATLK